MQFTEDGYAPGIPARITSMLEQQIATRSVHDPDFAYFRRFDPNTTIFLDVGANIGNSALSISAACPGARIIGFEPNKMLLPLLERTKTVVPTFDYHQFGLADTEQARDLYVPVVDGTAILGEASIHLDHFNEDVVRRRLVGYGSSGTFRLYRLQALFKRLDDLRDITGLSGFARNVVMKIDVEGAELDVLRGGTGFINAARPLLLIENGERWEISAFLSGLGYVRHLLDGQSLRLAHDTERRLNSFFVHRDTI